MKIAQIIFLLFCLTFTIAGQESKWTRIEAENKEFSVSFPPNFIVNADTRESNQRYQIFGFLDGTKLELKVYKDIDARQRLDRISDKGTVTEAKAFKAEGFVGKSFMTNSKSYLYTVYLASNDYFYILQVAAKTSQKPEINRFLRSIKLKETALFVQKENTEPEDEIIAMSALKTSPEVSEALNRKNTKTERKIIYEAGSDFPASKLDDSIRPAIILYRPPPSRFPDPFSDTSNVVIKIRYQLLANGQVGDITVYSATDPSLTKGVIDSIIKMKFIPAQKDGKFIDSEENLVQTFQSFVKISQITNSTNFIR